jgi:hypothetical protein
MSDTEPGPLVTGNPDPRETFAGLATQFMAAIMAEQIPSDVMARIAFAAGGFSGDVLRLLPTPDGESARNFPLGDNWVEITCPRCSGEITIVEGYLFAGGSAVTIVDGRVFGPGSDEGIPLDHPATLGDLLDAANAHVCEASND